MLKVFLISALLLLTSQAAKYQRTVKYDNEILIRCPTGVEGMKEFLQRDDVDVWRVTPDGLADIRINKNLIQGTDIILKQCTTIADVEELVQQFENMTASVRLHGQAQQEWHEEYHRYDEIYDWYKELAEQCGERCQFNSSIGGSLEGRVMPAFHVGSPAVGKIYFQCQIHAREWISGATCMYIADSLTNNPEGLDMISKVLDDVEFIFVPLVNPDGYEYTWTGDRLWRKNRRENSGSACIGVDLNRNYNDHWNEGGSSSNPCSETYHGVSAASEPETQNTQSYFKTNGPIIGAIDWHSYSQLILRPYGWTNQDSPDETQLKEIGDEMSEKIKAVFGETYTSQKSIGLYPTSGTASDWFYGEDATSTNGAYRAAGYTVELRDTGSYGFLLPPEQIIPTGMENLEGVLEFAERLIAAPIPNPYNSHKK
ncbi:PREDICTED: carboxypeptidase B-like isoform X2 [Amphimedon queenslandica]|uniref:Peptidase M14 domain-containing protein n=1 Tax=Amphimedon queenslandica TaxID=400682 RepID=A0AAN0J299_AMPQE|nr:PREDICTED: carboxypeptidase B-like isoform X2 [Amphimedon queenslandica]|eukprot:XP_019851169.1 PREDICTED: carboxypeptidase B-like isoform X2 [Amphimedon queenslandica]